MAYQTGSATSPANLLDTIRIFLLAQGWTVNFWGADPQVPATNMWLAVTSATGSYFNFICDGSSVSVRGATGYTASGVTRDSQPGKSPQWAVSNGLTGPYAAYYLFVGASYCHVVVEPVTNQFVHFHVGTMDKAGNYVGGEYQTNTYWLYGNVNYQNDANSNSNTMPFDTLAYYSGAYQYYRMDVDGAVNNWVLANPVGGNTTLTNAYGFMRAYSLTHRLFNRSPNHLTGQAVLLPGIICGPRPSGGAAIYGTIKDVRSVNIANLTPKQTVPLGSDQWMVFPIIRKGTGTIYEAVSGNYGLAYKKN